MKTLKVLLLSDGKPGHITQTLGLVGYLKKKFWLQHDLIEVKPRIKIANRFLRILLNRNSRYATLFFNWLYKLNEPKTLSHKPDIIISTGGNTCGVNAILAKKFACKNIFLGSLRGHDPRLFTSIITTTPMPDIDNAIVLDVAPTLIDQEKLQEAAKEFLDKHKILPNKNLWVMLIGGEGSGYSYSGEDYKTLANAMLVLAKKYNIRWLLTTSRRTGLANERVLQTSLQDRDEIAYAVFFNQKFEKIMQAYLGAGEMIFCTEDSTSMVSEAVVSQKPVFTLRGSIKNPNKGHLAVIDRFARHNYIYRLMVRDFFVLSPDEIKHEVINIEKNYEQILDIAIDNNSNQA